MSILRVCEECVVKQSIPMEAEIASSKKEAACVYCGKRGPCLRFNSALIAGRAVEQKEKPVPATAERPSSTTISTAEDLRRLRDEQLKKSNEAMVKLFVSKMLELAIKNVVIGHCSMPTKFDNYALSEEAVELAVGTLRDKGFEIGLSQDGVDNVEITISW